MWLHRSWTLNSCGPSLYLFVLCYPSWFSFNTSFWTNADIPSSTDRRPSAMWKLLWFRRQKKSVVIPFKFALTALNKAMESFISPQRWNTDTISQCQDCSQNKVHIDFHAFYSSFFSTSQSINRLCVRNTWFDMYSTQEENQDSCIKIFDSWIENYPAICTQSCQKNICGSFLY